MGVMSLYLLWAIIIFIFTSGGFSQPEFLPIENSHLLACYNESAIFNKNYHYPAQSLENLLAIIEKIERHYAFYSLPFSDIAMYLLTRFRFDGISKKAFTYENRDLNWIKDLNAQSLQTLQHAIVSRGYIQEKYKLYEVNFLTLEEKCSLHWMLSHTLNITTRGDENNRALTPPPFQNNRFKRQINPGPPNIINSVVSRNPLEWGVMYTPSGTVATSLVLLGLSTVTTQSDSTATIASILPTLSINDLFKRETIDIRIASYGPIALAADGGIQNPGGLDGNTNSKIGPDGWWNCSVCPNEFTLRYKATLATDAEVYGALDGFHLGMKIRDATSSYLQLKLSHILRMYYNRGIFGDLRACNRFKMLKEYAETDRALLTNNLGKLIVALGKTSGTVTNLDAGRTRADRLLNLLLQNYTEGSVASKTQCPDVTTLEPETIPLVDLYVVLDNNVLNDPIRYDEAATLIGEVGNLMDIATNASHIGVYINDVRLFDYLYPINRTFPAAELKCKLKWMKFDNFQTSPRANMAETIKKLKQHFTERGHYEDERGFTKTPAKVVMFFLSGQQLGSNIEDVRWMLDLLRRDHPEVEILATGSSSANVEVFVANTHEDFFNFGSLLEAREVAERIYARLQKFGSLLYYPQCYNWGSGRRENVMITSYIGNNTRHFHTVPSKAFNASSYFRIEVRASFYSLKVCVSRSEDIFVVTNRVQCSTVDAGAASQTIFYNNACNHLSRFCPSIYLRVETLPSAASLAGTAAVCVSDTQMCRTADEAPYYITITGGYCGCSAIRATFSVLLLSLFIIFRNQLS